MTTTTVAHQEQRAATATARVRNVVLQYARDDADAAELLDMLGLAEDQQQDSTTPRCRGGLAGRPPGGVHALSAATETRLGSIGCTANNAPITTQATEQAAAAPTARPDAAVDRRCAGCGVPVVPQTRYRLDPDGYRQRGIKRLAAKERCHPCYNQQRRPAAPVEPENPRYCGKCERPMVSARVFNADPDGWRERGWTAHAAHGVCQCCEARTRRSRRRVAVQTPVLRDLASQLTALRQQVRNLRISHPDDVPLACVSAALGEARRHLHDVSIRIANGSDDAPDQDGDR